MRICYDRKDLGNYYELLSGNATNWVLIIQELVRNFFNVLPENLTEKATLFPLSSPQTYDIHFIK